MQILIARVGGRVSGIFQWDMDTLRYMTELGGEMLNHEFQVRRDFRPPRGSANMMCALPHHRLNNDVLRAIQRDGLEALWHPG